MTQSPADLAQKLCSKKPCPLGHPWPPGQEPQDAPLLDVPRKDWPMCCLVCFLLRKGTPREPGLSFMFTLTLSLASPPSLLGQIRFFSEA